MVFPWHLASSTVRIPEGGFSNYLCSIALPFASLATTSHLSTLSSFVLYPSLPPWTTLRDSITISSERCPLCLSFSSLFSYLSRSEWLCPISLHQMDGAFQGPWRWCCSLGGTQWANMFEGCWCTAECGESWKNKVKTSSSILQHCCIEFTWVDFPSGLISTIRTVMFALPTSFSLCYHLQYVRCRQFISSMKPAFLTVKAVHSGQWPGKYKSWRRTKLHNFLRHKLLYITTFVCDLQ